MLHWLRFTVLDIVLESIFSALVIGTLVICLLPARSALHRLSFRARRRLPFGLAGLALVGCCVVYTKLTFSKLPPYPFPMSGTVSLPLQIERMAVCYLWFSALALASAPAIILGRIWWDFRRPTADRVLSRGHRPVLLFRTFEGDESESGPSRELERILSRKLRAVGPLVGLGSPKDFSPPGGAYRTYAALEPDAWKPQVAKYLEAAAAAVFVISRWSTSIEWELELVRARFKAHRTVVIVPPNSGHDRWQSGAFRTDTSSTILQRLGVADLDTMSNSVIPRHGVVLAYGEEWNLQILKGAEDIHELAEAAAEQLRGRGPVPAPRSPERRHVRDG